MNRNTFLALAVLAATTVSTSALASDNLLSRAFTIPDGHGRWINRRLTLRHHNQDAPKACRVETPRRDELSRAFSLRHDRGRWFNREFMIRHHETD